MVQHHRHRQHKAHPERHQTQPRRRPCAPAGQRLGHHRTVRPTGPEKPRLAPPHPFERHKHKDQRQDHPGDLRRPARIVAVQPCGKHARGQRLHPEMRDRPVIRHRLHQRQRHARGDGGPRQRQTHPQEQRPRPRPQRPRHVIGRPGLFAERRPRQQIDIRIQRRRQHDHRHAARPHLGEPVVPRRLPPHRAAQGGLHRPCILQEIHHSIGPHIGRDGQGKQQRVIQPAAARKAVHHHQPRRPRSHRRRQKAHAPHQQQRVAEIAGQHGVHKMRPDVLGRVKGDPDHRQHGGQHDGGNQHRTDGPAVQPQPARKNPTILLRHHDRGLNRKRFPCPEKPV